MFRKTLTAALLSVAGVNAHASLTTGDLAFTSFNADEDGWSLVTFVDIAANTTIYFTDNEWNGGLIGAGGAFNTGESYHQWSTGASVISAGSVIRFSSIDTTSLASSIGAFSRASVSGSTNYGISATADTIYAYQGSSATAPTTFLSAISTGAFSATDGSLINTGLALGVSALQLGNASDYAEYVGARSGQVNFEAYKPLVANVANWSDLGDGSFAAKVPDTSTFSVAAVPVPGAVWMFGSSLLAFLSISRRKG